MSEEKTIELGAFTFAVPFTVNDPDGRNFLSIVDLRGLPIGHTSTRAEAEAITAALNFQHVEFPKMVEKMNALRAKLYQEYLDSDCSGIDSMRLEVADRMRGICGVLEGKL
jgi:hypothetical protein